MARGRRIYKFTEKSHSKRAVISFCISAVLVAIYVAFIYLAYKGDGGLSPYYGSVGVMAMLISVVSTIISITTLGEEDSFQLFPRLSLLTSILACVCWIGTYILGFMRG
jgi:4-hydroxybenzoate polyprenyltransferase